MQVDTRWCVTLDTAVLRGFNGAAAVKAHLEVYGGGVGNLYVLAAQADRTLALVA